MTSTGYVTIGEGRLTWPRIERVCDRYGAIMLMRHGDSLSDSVSYVDPDLSAVGQFGSLVAVVLETRESTHIGDLFRGLFPETPSVGDEIVLGSGWLFSEPRHSDGFVTVGLAPSVERDSDWLDPRQLYRAHEQTVRLEFHPGSSAPVDPADARIPGTIQAARADLLATGGAS